MGNINSFPTEAKICIGKGKNKVVKRATLTAEHPWTDLEELAFEVFEEYEPDEQEAADE